MSYELSGSQTNASPERPRVWMERLLLIAFLFCLVIGLVALGTLLALRNSDKPILNADPLQLVRTEQILPQLALRELAGDAPAGLAVQALQAGQLETARAALTYATTVPAVEQSGRLAQLGRAYLAAGDPTAAAQVFRLVLPFAVLNDTIPTQERIQLLVQAADGYAATDNPDAARDALIQAQRIAVQAPDLVPARRADLFAEMRRVAEPLDDTALEQQLADLARNPYLIGSGVLITPTLATLAQPLPYDTLTLEKIAAREEAARIFADRIELTGGVDIEPEREALAQALRDEDQARTQFYDNPGEISRGQQFWLPLEERAWLVTRLRLADGAYGISVVPEWEANRSAIAGQLAALDTYIDSLVRALADSQPSPVEQAMVRIEGRHWLAEQAERGLYADAPVGDISEQLRIAQDDLARLGSPPALPTSYEPNATPPGFRIQAAP
ncbi:MAG: hypothetical protein M9936_30880 [Caldilinea sp.]|nr:hypothetical protein [Caldilineaceae bacterium]MCO5214125.1 hypothetical protein [Caldilinea sp.]MCW5842291.1 hypothetical protein [Caldilinea sp.]